MHSVFRSWRRLSYLRQVSDGMAVEYIELELEVGGGYGPDSQRVVAVGGRNHQWKRSRALSRQTAV